MEKLIESIWNAAVLYCNKINEVALHPNNNPEDGPTQITKYNNKLEDLSFIIKNAGGSLVPAVGEETQSDDGEYFEPIQAITLRVAGEYKHTEFFSEW